MDVAACTHEVIGVLVYDTVLGRRPRRAAASPRRSNPRISRDRLLRCHSPPPLAARSVQSPPPPSTSHSRLGRHRPRPRPRRRRAWGSVAIVVGPSSSCRRPSSSVVVVVAVRQRRPIGLR